MIPWGMNIANIAEKNTYKPPTWIIQSQSLCQWRLACGKFGVGIPVATDLCRKNTEVVTATRSNSSTAKRLAIGVSITESRR